VKLAWPNLKTEVSADSAATLLKLIDVLDDDDDVQTVWANYEIPDEVMEKRPDASPPACGRGRNGPCGRGAGPSHHWPPSAEGQE
jgi:hypothetical protein